MMEIRLRDFVFNRSKIRDYELLFAEQEKALIEFEGKVETLTDEIDVLGGRLDKFPIKVVEKDEQPTDAE